MRAYSLIADVLNAYDLSNDAPSGSRRRERRLFRDRRALSRSLSESEMASKSDNQTSSTPAYMTDIDSTSGRDPEINLWL